MEERNFSDSNNAKRTEINYELGSNATPVTDKIIETEQNRGVVRFQNELERIENKINSYEQEYCESIADLLVYYVIQIGFLVMVVDTWYNLLVYYSLSIGILGLGIYGQITGLQAYHARNERQNMIFVQISWVMLVLQGVGIVAALILLPIELSWFIILLIALELLLNYFQIQDSQIITDLIREEKKLQTDVRNYSSYGTLEMLVV